MLTPPPELPEDLLVAVLDRGWGLTVTSLAYRPVGWGSHHWEVTGPSGTRWFVTADELENKRHALTESLTEAFGRLRASLATAVELREVGGLEFVVAPVPARDGQPLVRASQRFSVALFPWVDGQSFDWGDFPGQAYRRAVLDMLVAIHTAPQAAARHALADDFTIPHRDELEAALAGADASAAGPFAGPLARLMAEHAAPVRAALDNCDEQGSRARAEPARPVVTHGEPHPGNTMLAGGRWLFIDWDTVLMAPPERDLWSLDPGDRSVLAAYAAATGVTPRPALLELYRVRWDLADVAVDVSRFRRPHQGSPEDEKAFELLRSVVEDLG